MINALKFTILAACLLIAQNGHAQTQIRKGDIIVLEDSQPICRSKESLERFVRLGLERDSKGIAEMFSNDGSSECSMIPADRTKFRVLEAEYDMPDIGIIKISTMHRTDGNGVWTLSPNLKIVK